MVAIRMKWILYTFTGLLSLILLGTLSGCTNSYEFDKTLEGRLKVLGARLLIDEGAAYTQQRRVGLRLFAENAEEMKVSNRADCADGDWQPYQHEVPWDLLSENKEQAVFAQFRSVDGVDSACVSDSIEHDNLPPTVSWLKAPARWSSEIEPEFKIESYDLGSGTGSVSCFDGANSEAQDCSLFFRLKTFSDGPQSLRVNVADRAGNSTFLHHQWRRDTVKPQVRFLAKPLDQIGETQASFRFAAEDDASGVSSLECRTHSETSFHSCQSPANLMQLGEGQHIFFVRAKDKAGNYSEELSHAWNVDLTAPALTLVSRPQKYERSTRADFRWKVEDQFAGVDNVLCEWNQQPAHPCSEQDSLQGVSEGLHTWSVRAVDKVGNKSQPLRVQWVNDMTPPNLNWIRTPAEMDQSQQALIQFVADDSISGMDQTSCWLDEKLYPCTSQAPVELNGLGVGWHSFRVSARDRSGNTEEMVHRWLVYPAARGVEETWNISSYGAVDLLFVVDSSKSMDAERTEMGRRFGDLMGQLSGLDWQIAMTTTDVQSMDGRSRGQLMDFLGIGLPILTAQIPADQAWAAFRDTIENAKEGDPYERGIFATYMALERYQQDLAAQQFFRKNSHLEVIVITDADNSGNEFMDQPQNLFDYVKNLFGPEKNFSFHSLIVEPGDRACVKQGESYGEKYFRLSQMTSGVVGSVCAKDYGQVVLEVGLKIRERHRERNLQCAPYDANRDGIPDFSIHSTPEARPPLRYQFEGSKVRFDQFLPLGTHQVKYNCIKNIP